MSKTELKEMIIEETKELSKDTLMEVLDLIKLIKTKKTEMKSKKTFEKKMVNELTHLEEEFANYKELYPREQ